MSLDFNMKIEALNVPPDLQHKTRPIEIEELTKYLQVNIAGTGTKSIINFGAQPPSPEDSKFPWLKLNPNGTAAGWYVMVNGLWTVVGGQGNVPPDHSLAISPTGIIYLDHTIPYAPILTLSGGIPPYSFSADLGGAGTMTIPPVMAGLNNELIYPTGLTSGLHTLAFTDSEKSSILLVPFSIDAAPGTQVICTPTTLVLSLGAGTVSGTLSGGTAPYYFQNCSMFNDNRYASFTKPVFNVAVASPNITVTPASYSSSPLVTPGTYYTNFVDSSGVNTVQVNVVVVA